MRGNTFEKYEIFSHILVDCCGELIITSTGAAIDYNSDVLGTYRKNGISNGMDSYKYIYKKDPYVSREKYVPKKMGMYPKGKGYVSKAASKLSVRRTLTLQPGGSRRRS